MLLTVVVVTDAAAAAAAAAAADGGGGVTAEPKTEAQPLQVTVAPTATECHVRIPRITAEVSCGCG